MEERRAALALMADGLSAYEVGRRLGIHRATVNYWRHHPEPHRRYRYWPKGAPTDWAPGAGPVYCYLLGLYLGDGYVWRVRGSTPTLWLTLDTQYPGIIAEAMRAMERVFAGAYVRTTVKKTANCAMVKATHPAVMLAFPQHGAGRKHKRRIELAPWQLELTRRHPKHLLRGLMHSDGCRCVNRFTVVLPKGGPREYSYVRYFFSNLSGDILAIFCKHCELLGIRWTQSNHRNISISHRRSVALMDSFVGPKT